MIMTKLAYGVGYNSKNKHRAAINRKPTEAYDKWRRMLERCYCIDYKARNPTYMDCHTQKDWHDYQNFAEWFYRQSHSNLGYQLDKDLLFSGNKIYSPETCCLVPKEINYLLTSNDASRGNLPQGASLLKGSCKYRATISIDNKNVYLGLYDTPEEAHQVYKVAKEANVKDMAVKWRSRITEDVFNALMAWHL